MKLFLNIFISMLLIEFCLMLFFGLVYLLLIFPVHPSFLHYFLFIVSAPLVISGSISLLSFVDRKYDFFKKEI